MNTAPELHPAYPAEPCGRPMAKKKKSDSDEIISKLDKDVAEESGGEQEPVVPENAEELHGYAAEFVAWPCEPDHGSARDVLLGKGATEVRDDDVEMGKGSGLNLFLLALLLGVAGVGIWKFREVSSQEALDAKRMAREAMEQAHLEEQLAKQKKYGILRVETNPPQAIVFKDGEKIVTKNAAGEELVGKTPMNMMDLDVSQAFKVKVQLDGYDEFEFGVAPHLWTKDTATGEYKFIKMIDLTPNVCEYWFLYDAKKRREEKFEDKAKCLEYFDDATGKQQAVTECTCKIPPEGWTPPEKKDDKKKDGKKGKKK